MVTARTCDSADWGECVWSTSNPDIVTARDRGLALAEALGLSATDQVAVEQTIVEFANSLLTYSRSGEIRLEVVRNAAATGLSVVARDWGSTVLGFSDIQRLTEDVEMHSRAGRGTIATVTKWLHSAKSSAA